MILPLFINRLKQLSPGQQVLLAFGLICGILVAIGGLFFFSLRAIERLNEEQQSALEHQMGVVREASKNGAMIQAAVFRHMMESEVEGIQRHDLLIRRMGTANVRKLAEYERFIDTETERLLHDRVTLAWKVYWEQTQPVLKLSSSNLDNAALAFALSNQAPAYAEYHKAVDKLTDYSAGEARAATTATTRFIDRTIKIVNLLVGITILIAIGTGLAVVGVARRLKDDNGILQNEVAERKRAESEIEEAHKQLLDLSRQAGMAEVATNVLHNVGNVLNSVNVSAIVVVDGLKKSKVSGLARVVALLREHERDLGAFITSDSRGKQLPTYLAELSDHLLFEQETTVKEMDSLRANIEHIKKIVAMQQNYANGPGVTQIVNVSEMVEDSLRMNDDALIRHRIEVVREFEHVPPMTVDKHKVLQILVNLVRNAKYACDESARADRQVTVQVANGHDRVKISVVDNGVGIAPDHLTRIFNHGFATRKEGRGFGLHSGALAAQELGGSLTVQSDGLGQGATFILELPLNSHRS